MADQQLFGGHKMSRSQSVNLAVVIAFLSYATVTRADDPAPAPQGPVPPLGEYVRQLKDPDREKRLAAAEAIRDHYKGKSLDALPQLLRAFGEELDRPQGKDVGRVIYLGQVLRQAVDGAGADRLKVIRESTRHTDPYVRAASFQAWMGAAYDKDTGATRDELLTAVRRGLKDGSPLVRGQAVTALHAFRDWPPTYVAQPGFKDAPPEVMAEVVSLLATALDDRTEKFKGGVALLKPFMHERRGA